MPPFDGRRHVLRVDDDLHPPEPVGEGRHRCGEGGSPFRGDTVPPILVASAGRASCRRTTSAGNYELEDPGGAILGVRHHRGQQEIGGRQGESERLALSLEEVERALRIAEDVAGVRPQRRTRPARPSASRRRRTSPRIAGGPRPSRSVDRRRRVIRERAPADDLVAGQIEGAEPVVVERGRRPSTRSRRWGPRHDQVGDRVGDVVRAVARRGWSRAAWGQSPDRCRSSCASRARGSRSGAEEGASDPRSTSPASRWSGSSPSISSIDGRSLDRVDRGFDHPEVHEIAVLRHCPRRRRRCGIGGARGGGGTCGRRGTSAASAPTRTRRTCEARPAWTGDQPWPSSTHFRPRRRSRRRRALPMRSRR